MTWLVILYYLTLAFTIFFSAQTNPDAMCLRHVERLLGEIDLTELANAELFTQIKPTYNWTAFLHARPFFMLVKTLEECARRHLLIH
jgi:hypothetical protein